MSLEACLEKSICWPREAFSVGYSSPVCKGTRAVVEQ